VKALRQRLAAIEGAEARRLEVLADYLVRKSIWLLGGDGWAYDIGYGGLDHVLASDRNVNVLVLDTEVYSNTGGQQSKATPLGAVAKFASAGKNTAKKDLGLLANSYGHVYVARVAMGAKMPQTVQAMLEAEAYPGPSLIIAYSHCIAHGYDMAHGMSQQKLAVDSGVWPLYRFDPRRLARGEAPLHLDYGPPKARVADYMRNESRFRMVERTDPARFAQFLKRAQEAARKRYAVYQQLAGITVPQGEAKDEGGAVGEPEK
jgi:pyruvate-ferredoxin/flavodoxin oxidoreductase